MRWKVEVDVMATARAEHPESAKGIGLMQAVLASFDGPALLAHKTGTILAANAAWEELFASPNTSSKPASVHDWCDMLDNGDSLASAFATGTNATGPRTACVSHRVGDGVRRFEARVASTRDERGDTGARFIVMLDSPPAGPGVVIDEAQFQMHRLLVRQTLIEERERRRLGRALHDQVTQLLVHMRRRLAGTREARGTQDPTEMIGDIDRVIHLLDEITSNFSPPVLEDLGLLPAMRWLADHVKIESGASASCEDDGIEPRLSSEARTIAFRALRELVNNAVKHAPSASIHLCASTDDGRCRLEVRDNGPGFTSNGDLGVRGQSQTLPGYGLLSIEQQIRAVGGTFEIQTAPGKGTTAIITLDCSSTDHHKENEDA